jgi:hypothetical protein
VEAKMANFFFCSLACARIRLTAFTLLSQLPGTRNYAQLQHPDTLKPMGYLLLKNIYLYRLTIHKK